MLPNPRRPLWGEPANSHIRPTADGRLFSEVVIQGAAALQNLPDVLRKHLGHNGRWLIKRTRTATFCLPVVRSKVEKNGSFSIKRIETADL